MGTTVCGRWQLPECVEEGFPGTKEGHCCFRGRQDLQVMCGTDSVQGFWNLFICWMDEATGFIQQQKQYIKGNKVKSDMESLKLFHLNSKGQSQCLLCN